METGMKIGIGVSVALLVGTGIYFGFIHKTKPVTGTGGKGGQPAGASTAPPPAKTGLEQKLDAVKKSVLQAKCNRATPPPRFKNEKIEEYKKCMLGADGYTWGNA